MRVLDDKLIDSLAEKNRAVKDKPATRQVRKMPGVLVVDDEHMMRILVQLTLERHGFEVWLASNGYEAIELYRVNKECIDVVLLDVCMPGLDGPRTLGALLELNPEVRACFMSGNLGSFESENLIQLRAACFIAKPFHLEKLADTNRQVANSSLPNLSRPARLGQTNKQVRDSHVGAFSTDR